MVLSADLINLLLYCVQQLGVTLAVGGQTVMLAAYLISVRDGVIDVKEAQYLRAVRAVIIAGLICIIVSGVGITVFHVLAHSVVPDTGQPVILTAAYLFKWLLVVIAVGLSFVKAEGMQAAVQGVEGGTWYALFLVHILAPATTWLNLITLYAVWLIGFNLCWWALVYFLRGKQPTTTVPKAKLASALAAKYTPPPPLRVAPLANPPKPPPAVLVTPPTFKPAPPPTQIPKPVAQTSAMLPVPKPPIAVQVPTPLVPPLEKQIPVLQKPEELNTAPPKEPGLPAIRVMPKTPQDLNNQK